MKLIDSTINRLTLLNEENRPALYKAKDVQGRLILIMENILFSGTLTIKNESYHEALVLRIFSSLFSSPYQLKNSNNFLFSANYKDNFQETNF